MSENFQSVSGDETRGSALARGKPSPEHVKKHENVAVNTLWIRSPGGESKRENFFSNVHATEKTWVTKIAMTSDCPVFISNRISPTVLILPVNNEFNFFLNLFNFLFIKSCVGVCNSPSWNSIH